VEKTFNIIPMSRTSFYICVIVFLAILAIPVVVISNEPAAWAGSLVAGIVCFGVVGVVASFLYQGMKATFNLTENGLVIRPGIYGRTVKKEKLLTAEARVIDLNYDRNYRPQWRTNGAGLPGYAAGHFVLKNGESALLFVTDNSSVVYIPTTEKSVILLSVRDAANMVEALKRWGK
jgi:hypothetical protein